MASSHPFLLRQIRVRPWLTVSIALGLAVAFGLPARFELQPVTRWIIGWNCGAILYLLLSAGLMARSTIDQMRERALMLDEGQVVILAMVIVAAVASLSSIVVELSVARGLHGAERYAHVALAGLTILSSWAFTHVMFAMHYAHEFYLARHQQAPGGLDFPGETEPDYLDFLYFSFVIGTSAQTADVSFTSRPMRRVGLAHCVLSFIFNTTVLALTINIAASLF